MTVTWGLGQEHEMAVAYFADGQWTRIPSVALNEIAEPATKKKPVKAAKPIPACIQVLRNGTYDRCLFDVTETKPAPCKFRPPDSAHSCLSVGVHIYMSVAGSRFAHKKYVEDHSRSAGESFDAHHAAICTIVAEDIQVFAGEAGIDKVSLTLNLAGFVGSLYIRPGDIPLAGVAKALKTSCEHIVIIEHSDPSRPERSERFEIDSTFVEIKSDKWERATIGSVSHELEVKQAEVLKFARLAAPKGVASTVGLLPHGMVTVGKNGSSTYAGSYHVWITMPYASGHAFDHNAFVRDHAALIRSFQWLEPLLLACMPADPRSPGSGSKFSRASMRSRLNGLSAFGISEMKPPEPRKVMCYDSLDALNAGEAPKVVTTDSVYTTAADGARINVLACQGATRWGQARAQWEAGIGSFINNAGADVRFDTCSGCAGGDNYKTFELDWNAAFVKTKDGIAVASRRDPDRPFEMDIDECKKGPVGVEFRVFDHFTGADKLYLSVVVLAAAASRVVDAPKPGDSAAWALQMREVALKGSRVPLSMEFWTETCAALGVHVPERPPHAYAGMNALLSALHEEYAGSSIAKVFGYHERQVFPDVNYRAWKLGFLAKCASDGDIASKVARALRAWKSGVPDLGPGWENDRYLLMEYIREASK